MSLSGLQVGTKGTGQGFWRLLQADLDCRVRRSAQGATGGLPACFRLCVRCSPHAMRLIELCVCMRVANEDHQDGIPGAGVTGSRELTDVGAGN